MSEPYAQSHKRTCPCVDRSTKANRANGAPSDQQVFSYRLIYYIYIHAQYIYIYTIQYILLILATTSLEIEGHSHDYSHDISCACTHFLPVEQTWHFLAQSVGQKASHPPDERRSTRKSPRILNPKAALAKLHIEAWDDDRCSIQSHGDSTRGT